jgi:hypothetical protein
MVEASCALQPRFQTTDFGTALVRRRHGDEHRVLAADPVRARRHGGGVDTRGLRAP